MSKKGAVIFGVLAVATVMGLGLWQFYFKDLVGSSGGGDIAYIQPVSSLTADVLGSQNWYAGVIEPQKTVKVNIESGRTVSEVKVKVGQRVKAGDLLFEYDLSSIEESLKTAELELDELINTAYSYQDQINSYIQELNQTGLSATTILSTTINMEQTKMDLRKNEYNQIKKRNQIDKLQAATGNTQVLAEEEGVIQKIDQSKMNSDEGDSLSSSLSLSLSTGEEDDGSFITILGLGNYRVKGMINEINARELKIGEKVLIRSRVDEAQTWTGTITSVDQQNSKSQSQNAWGDTDTQTTSTKYPFYIDLDSSEDLMLGQHVYIELDTYGTEAHTGLWLNEVFIVDAATDNPYVWVAGSNGRLEMRQVTLGDYDEKRQEYQIKSGLELTDHIAVPEDYYVVGMPTTDISNKPVEESVEEDEEEEEEEEEDSWDDEGWDDESWEDDSSDDEGWEDEDLTEVTEDEEKPEPTKDELEGEDEGWKSEAKEEDLANTKVYTEEEFLALYGNKYGSDDKNSAG